MKRFLTIVGYGLGGILVALALSLGAFTLASRRLGGPASPVEPMVNLTDSPTPSWEPTFQPTATKPPNPPKPKPEPDPTHTQSAPAPTSASAASPPSSPSGGSSSDGDPSGEGDGSDDHPGDD